ncbi:MAG TPA: hypothetical protein PLH03_04910 [Methylophilaceae bacterium]|nr:hypothetical protein [Methylophilaceae bacterium]
MADADQDAGVIQALLDRFNEQKLPRALELKERLQRGEKLNELDLHFLDETFSGFMSQRTLYERHPEFQPLVAKIIGMYNEITRLALENEQKAENS